ncbi:MAG TPA: PspA/IM30 family protein, partial [Acidimicrobiales bacterium]|nr:PspA/IM30 family protein [Acidimicrobiales bacterium]
RGAGPRSPDPPSRVGRAAQRPAVQHTQVADQEERLVATSQRLQAQIEQFRTKKETLKASYTAAEAQTKIGEAVSGISTSMGDAGATMQRAQDKIASMQARAGAMDELLASGALTDLTTPVTDIQAALDKAQSGSQVDRELAALKAQIAAAGPAGELPGAAPGEVTQDATDVDEVAEVSEDGTGTSAPDKAAAGGDTATGAGAAKIETNTMEPATADDVATGGTEQ